MPDAEAMHEHISLAIAMWSLSLPVEITHAQRQDLHDGIVKGLKYVGAWPESETKD